MDIFGLIALAKSQSGGAGKVFHFKGVKSAVNLLPIQGEEGDVYKVEEDNNYYAWNETSWVNIGNILTADQAADLINGMDEDIKSVKENLVLLQDTQPTSDDNRIWITETGNEVVVPSYEEFDELSGDVSDLKSAVNSKVKPYNIDEAVILNWFDKSKQDPNTFTETVGGVLCNPIRLPNGTYFAKGFNTGGYNYSGYITKKDGTTVTIPRLDNGVAYSGNADYGYVLFEVDDTVDYIQLRLMNSASVLQEFIDKTVIGTGSTPYPFATYYPYSILYPWLGVNRDNVVAGAIDASKMSPDFQIEWDMIPEYNTRLINLAPTDCNADTEETSLYSSLYFTRKFYLPPGEYTANAIRPWAIVGFITKKNGTVAWISRPSEYPNAQGTLTDPIIVHFEITEADDYVQFGVRMKTEDVRNVPVMLFPGNINDAVFPRYAVHYGIYMPWMRLDADQIGYEGGALSLKQVTDGLQNEVDQLEENVTGNYIGNEYIGAKISFDGDSIMAAGLGQKIYDHLKGGTYVNSSVWGARITRLPDETDTPISERYVTSIPNDADLVVISAGTNDFRNNAPIGTYADTDNTTLYGALKILCNGLAEKFPNNDVPIVFIMPLKRSDGLSPNANGLTLPEFCQKFKEFIQLYTGYYVIDMQNLPPLNPYNDTLALVDYASNIDRLHLSATGYDKVGEFIAKRIILDTVRY